MDHITPFHLKSETTMYVHARNMRRHKMCGVRLLRPENNRLNVFWIILMNKSIFVSKSNLYEYFYEIFYMVFNSRNWFPNYIISSSIFRWVYHCELSHYDFYIFFFILFLKKICWRCNQCYQAYKGVKYRSQLILMFHI